MKLVLASKNKKKLEEMNLLLSKMGVEVLGPCRTCMRPEVELSVSVAHWPGETPAVGAGVGVATGVGVAVAASNTRYCVFT